MIEAQSADGIIHEFPDNTEQSVIDFTMRRHAINHPLGPQSNPPDSFFIDTPPGHILDAFGQGASQNWGAPSGQYTKETESALAEAGLAADNQSAKMADAKSFSESILRRSAAALWGFLGGPAQLQELEAQTSKAIEPAVGGGIAGALGMPSALESFEAASAKGPRYRPGITAGQMMPKDILENPALLMYGTGTIGRVGRDMLARLFNRAPPLVEEAAALKVIGPETARADPNITLPEVVVTPEKPPPLEAGKPGVVESIKTPEDVARTVQETVKPSSDIAPELAKADLADSAGVPRAEIVSRDLGTAEEIIAKRELVEQSSRSVSEAAAEVVKAPTDDAAITAYMEAVDRHNLIKDEVLRTVPPEEIAVPRTATEAVDEAQLAARLETTGQLNNFLDKTSKPGWKDYIIEAWINSLLSGPITHLKNIIGNAAVAVNSLVETAGTAAVGAARRAVGLGGAERVLLGEVRARFEGLIHGTQEGLKAAGRALLDESTVITRRHTVEQEHFQAIPSITVTVGGIPIRVGGATIRLPGRFLTAEDELFYAIATHQELSALAYRQAATEGLTGSARAGRIAKLLRDPTPEMQEAARLHGEYQTFTNPLGPTARAIQQFANSHLLAKVVFPFIRTPVNLVKYAAERTPLGLLSKEVRENLSGRNGDIARDTQYARLALGTTVATTVATWAATGHITGGGPTNPNEQAALRRTGWQPYSIRIGDMYYSYNWLDPLSLVMEVTADLTDAARRAAIGQDDLEKIGASVVTSISRNILGSLSLRGASDLLNALTDPGRYGPKYLQQLAGSVVPSIVAQTARTSDPVLREARTMLDAIRARIPGLREGLLPRRDIWGEPTIQGPQGFANPIITSQFHNDPVNAKMQALGNFPAPVARTIQGVALSDAQHDDYARVAGRLAKMRLDKIVGEARFGQMPSFAQTEVITKVIEGAREQARAMVMQQNPDIMKAMVAEKRAEIAGERPKRPIPQAVAR